MTHSKRTLRLRAMRAMLASFATFAVSGAEAQWFPPVGAASPAEIAERLRAQGYALTGPLLRKDTIYLADVTVGPGGHERLVIDAWSGEILQRFVGRPGAWRQGPGGYVIERGEFDSPPPLAPPPARDFFFGPGGGNFAYGGPPGARIPEAVGPVSPPEATPKSKVKPRPAGTTRKPADSRPSTAAVSPGQQVTPPDSGAAPTTGANQTANDNPGAAAAPSAAAPAGAPAASPPPAPAARLDAPSSPAGAPAQPQETSRQAPSASVAQTQRKEEAPPARSEPASAPTPKPSDKSKVNDVPVNPLE